MTCDIGLHEVCVRTAVRYVITKFSGMDSLPNFLTHGAPLQKKEVPISPTSPSPPYAAPAITSHDIGNDRCGSSSFDRSVGLEAFTLALEEPFHQKGDHSKN